MKKWFIILFSYGVLVMQVTLILMKTFELVDWNWCIILSPILAILVCIGLLIVIAILCCFIISGMANKEVEKVKHDSYYDENGDKVEKTTKEKTLIINGKGDRLVIKHTEEEEK